MTESAKEGIRSLGEFAKKDLFHWIRQNNPQLTFNIKSRDRSIRILMMEQKVILKSKNIGNKRPGIYK